MEIRTCMTCATLPKCHNKQAQACKTYVIGDNGKPILAQVKDWARK